MMIDDLIVANAARWATVEVSHACVDSAKAIAKRIAADRDFYSSVSKATGVPWWVIGIIHYREADFSIKASLAQGDPWNKVSTHVPRGRGPFVSWQEAAIDALKNCAPYAARWKDWSFGGALTLLEEYNGLGYERVHHEASPYLWAATNHEEWGKYTADGEWHHDIWDKQLGAAAILKALCELGPLE